MNLKLKTNILMHSLINYTSGNIIFIVANFIKEKHNLSDKNNIYDFPRAPSQSN